MCHWAGTTHSGFLFAVLKGQHVSHTSRTWHGTLSDPAPSTVSYHSKSDVLEPKWETVISQGLWPSGHSHSFLMQGRKNSSVPLSWLSPSCPAGFSCRRLCSQPSVPLWSSLLLSPCRPLLQEAFLKGQISWRSCSEGLPRGHGGISAGTFHPPGPRPAHPLRTFTEHPTFYSL